MNSSKRALWIAFWIGVVLVVTALSWVSVTVYALEERNATARAVNQRQEVIRLSLWRMDSRLAPMIALEAARPIEDYEMVLGDPQGAKNTLDDSEQESAQIIDPASYAQGYFEVDQSGLAKGTDQRIQQIASKALIDDDPARVDTHSLSAFSGASADVMSESSNVDVVDELPASDAMLTPPNPREESDPESDFQARQKIADLAQNTTINQNRKRASGDGFVGYMEPKVTESKDKRAVNSAMIVPEELRSHRAASDGSEAESGLLADRAAESRPNTGAALSHTLETPQQPSRAEFSRAKSDESQIEIGAIEPRWIRDEQGNPELVLVRTINREGGVSIQGVLLDWDTISTELIASIEDLLPTSTLEPILEPNLTAGSTERSYRLATIPVAFIPGGAIAVDGDSLTPAMIAMLVTWIAVMIAMIAVGLVLRTVLTLSARRARFVGAVTHELRTPLTTFRLYSQMLADGMVTDESVRKEYLSTLKRESDRLTGIVENVLEYARISRQPGRQKEKPKGEQQLSVGELMARLIPPMSRLGEQSGMDLIVSDDTSIDAERTVTLDPHAVERIMMNLMDNACKYAGGGDAKNSDDLDLRVHLDAEICGDALLLRVADHGPGVQSKDRRKIFGEFVRGSSPSLSDRSGLGLGLALSRGLALEMGGDLSLTRKRGHGAEFELQIPLDEVSNDDSTQIND